MRAQFNQCPTPDCKPLLGKSDTTSSGAVCSTSRPSNAVKWSDATSWKKVGREIHSTILGDGNKIPGHDDYVVIHKGRPPKF